MSSSMTISCSLLRGMNNPVYFSELICSACMGFEDRKANLLDLYVILPLLLYEGAATKFKRVTKNSSIYSLFLQDNIIGLTGLEDRIERLYKDTVNSIIIIVNMEKIEIEKDNLDIIVNTKTCKEIQNKIKSGNRLYKEAFNLGKILSKNETKENYRLLGVKKICFV